jgi:hypothetical protein
MRWAARLRSWEPTVTPIWASSPAAWTAVVTISTPLGRPSLRGGGGGGDGRWAAVAFGCVAAAGERVAFGFAARLAFGFDLAAGRFVAGDDFERADFLAAGFAGDAVAARRAVVALARRSPPSRVGRVERRVPSTLASAAPLEDFFDFFLAVFWLMDTVNGRGGRRPL